jgi:hypothetical protein
MYLSIWALITKAAVIDPTDKNSSIKANTGARLLSLHSVAVMSAAIPPALSAL